MADIKRYWVLGYYIYYPSSDNVIGTFVRREDAEAFAKGLQVPDRDAPPEEPDFKTDSEMARYREGLNHLFRFDEVEVHDMSDRIFEGPEVNP